MVNLVDQQQRTLKRQKQLPTSYYDPAFTDPYYYHHVAIQQQQQQHQRRPSYGSSSGGKNGHAGSGGGSTGQGSKSGDIIFPKIDVNSIFF